MSEETQKDSPLDEEPPTEQVLPQQEEVKQSLLKKETLEERILIDGALTNLINLGFVLESDDEEDTCVLNSAELDVKPKTYTRPLVLFASDFEKFCSTDSDEDHDKEFHGGEPGPNLESAITQRPSKRPLMATANEDNESQGKEKRKKEEPHGVKRTDVEQLRPYLERLAGDILTEISLMKELSNYQMEEKVVLSDNLEELRSFIEKKLEEDISPSDLNDEIKKLKKKYEPVVAEAKNILNGMLDRSVFECAHYIWCDQRNSDLLWGAESVNQGFARTCLDALRRQIYTYLLINRKHPFESIEAMKDFFENQFQLNIPVVKLFKIIQALRKKYKKRAGSIFKRLNVNEKAFYEAKRLWWGDKLQAREAKQFLRVFKQNHDLSDYPFLRQAAFSHLGSENVDPVTRGKIEEEFHCMETWQMQDLENQCMELIHDNANSVLRQKVLLLNALFQ